MDHLVFINAKYAFLDIKTTQIFYVISTWTAQFNSCVNPFVYFLKNPEFRTHTKNLFW